MSQEFFYNPAPSTQKKKNMSIQFMTQIFIKMSVNDASVKKHRNQQTVLSIFYSKRSYKNGILFVTKIFS